MKKFIIILIAVISISAQSWNSIIETTIPTPSTTTVIDQFSNSSGIHILIDNHYPSTYLKYYLINNSGTIIRNYQLESSDVDYANITGDNQTLYAVYKTGNSIRIKKSTNAGQNWDTFVSDISLGGYDCRNIDAVVDNINNRLHIVYDREDNGSDYETYYKKYRADAALEESKQVTDYGSEIGGFPTVSVSSSRVHVSFNSGNSSSPSTNIGDAKTRDEYTTTWQNPQLLYSGGSMRERVHAGSSKLLDFYYQLEGGMGQYHADLYVKERSFGSTLWSSAILLQQFAAVNNIVSATNTYDGKTHIIYEGPSSVAYRNYNGSSWSSETTFGSSYLSPKISATSNDLFVVWGEYNDYLKFRQYDANPLTPNSFSGSVSNNHPRLDWNINNEADLNGYEVWRQFIYDPHNPLAWTLIATTSNNYYVDNDVYIGDGSSGQAVYKIRAKDAQTHYSSYTSTVSFDFQGLQKRGYLILQEDTSKEYHLLANYPNPFNPSTTIEFQIPQEGFVSLRVYNTLGEEVATLVNKNLNVGNYSVNFIANDLPSGLYIYRLEANNFTSSKKMLLLR